MSLTIALVVDDEGKLKHYAQVNDIASELKQYGKAMVGSVVVRERRKGSEAPDRSNPSTDPGNPDPARPSGRRVPRCGRGKRDGDTAQTRGSIRSSTMPRKSSRRSGASSRGTGPSSIPRGSSWGTSSRGRSPRSAATSSSSKSGSVRPSARRRRVYFAKMRDSRSGGSKSSWSRSSRCSASRTARGSRGARADRRSRASSIDVRERFEEHAAHPVTVEIEDGMPPMLVRRRCLEVVLENLVSNAIKHGGGGGRRPHHGAALAKERRGDAKERPPRRDGRGSRRGHSRGQARSDIHAVLPPRERRATRKGSVSGSRS